MKTERYFVGPKLLGDMRDTIARVNGSAYRVNGGSLPGRPESIGEGGVSRPGFRMATFTGAWAINSGKTVTLYNASSTTETLVATNVLIPVPQLSSDANSPTVCSIAYDRGTWFLSAVQQANHEALTSVTLQPTRIEFGRKQFVAVATTLTTTGISITECDNEAASAEQLNWFFG
jgi:hypothetical protein